MNAPHEVDLHGLRPEAALRRVAQELHAARVRGLSTVVLVTGRGWGNLRQEPILRDHVQRWLSGAEARALGVRSTRIVSKGGALEVRLGDGPRRGRGGPARGRGG